LAGYLRKHLPSTKITPNAFALHGIHRLLEVIFTFSKGIFVLIEVGFFGEGFGGNEVGEVLESINL